MKAFSVKSIATACAIALSAAGAPVLAESADDRSSDLWSKASLTTTYTLNRHLNPFDIETEVHNGVATLRGTVESEAERDLAEELALGIDGIREVKNELTVSPEASPSHAGATTNDAERTFIRKVEDANLTAKVKSQLLWNGSISGLDIDVDTRNGVVTLSGDVNSDAEAELAEQIARNTDDVLGVENKLSVSGEKVTLGDEAARASREVQQEVSDGWITSKVKSALIYNRNVDGTDINVDTKNGVVSLRGQVDSEFEKDRAVEIARGVKGVKNVKAEFAAFESVQTEQ